MQEIHRRTKTIQFQRQLWPQPPKDARPYFCYINTLLFYEKGTCDEVWRQRIPEADQMRNERNKVGIYCMTVKYDKTFGWIIHFETSHDTAQAIWKLLFHRRKHERFHPVNCEKCWLELETKHNKDGTLAKKTFTCPNCGKFKVRH